MPRPTTLTTRDLREAIERYAQMVAYTEARVVKGQAITPVEATGLRTASHRVVAMLTALGAVIDRAAIPMRIVEDGVEELERIRAAMGSGVAMTAREQIDAASATARPAQPRRTL